MCTPPQDVPLTLSEMYDMPDVETSLDQHVAESLRTLIMLAAVNKDFRRKTLANRPFMKVLVSALTLHQETAPTSSVHQLARLKIDEWRSSGLSIKDFSLKRGITAESLIGLLKQYGEPQLVRRLIDEWRSGGLSIKDFSLKQGITAESWIGLLKKYGEPQLARRDALKCVLAEYVEKKQDGDILTWQRQMLYAVRSLDEKNMCPGDETVELQRINKMGNERRYNILPDGHAVEARWHHEETGGIQLLFKFTSSMVFNALHPSMRIYCRGGSEGFEVTRDPVLPLVERTTGGGGEGVRIIFKYPARRDAVAACLCALDGREPVTRLTHEEYMECTDEGERKQIEEVVGGEHLIPGLAQTTVWGGVDIGQMRLDQLIKLGEDLKIRRSSMPQARSSANATQSLSIMAPDFMTAIP